MDKMGSPEGVKTCKEIDLDNRMVTSILVFDILTNLVIKYDGRGLVGLTMVNR